MHNNLKLIRKIYKVSQKELADSLQVSKAMISMWENNLKEKIPQSRVIEIINFFDIDDEVLFSEEVDVLKLEKKAMRNTLDDLIERYVSNSELENLEQLKKVEQYHSGLSKEIENMLNTPDKLLKIMRLSQILNNDEIDSTFNSQIRPFALNSVTDNFLSLIEEKKTMRIDTLFLVLECLTILDEGKIKQLRALLLEFDNREEI